jgi:hypothetical protein
MHKARRDDPDPVAGFPPNAWTGLAIGISIRMSSDQAQSCPVELREVNR